MACYDRRFLIPYLRDVCCVEIFCSKIEREINNCENRIGKLEYEINRPIVDPQAPEFTDFNKKDWSGKIILMIMGIIPLVSGITFISWSLDGALNFPIGLVLTILGAFLLVAAFEDYFSEKQKNENDYNEAIKIYVNKRNANDDRRNNISKLQNELRNVQNNCTYLKEILVKFQTLRFEVYDVNIIPSKYRNIYASYYLYDYFSTCRENDLDKIIQTMLLDEIKQKLDTVIIQNEQIMLNQRLQIALQEQTNSMIVENHRKELQQIAQLEKNQELQIDYQNIIVKNQIVTNFLLASDYISKYIR